MRTILAVLSLTALTLTAACGGGVSRARTEPAPTAKPQPAAPTPPGVAAASACAAMKRMLDTRAANMSQGITAKIDTGQLRNQLSILHVSDVTSKWAALAAELTATATDAEATNKLLTTPGSSSQRQIGAAVTQMDFDANAAARECTRIPSAPETTGTTTPANSPACAAAQVRSVGSAGRSAGTTGGASPGAVVADLFATITAGGQMANGSCGATVNRVGTGRYQVTFTQDVSGCAAVANLGYVGTQEGPIAGPATVTVASGPGSHSVTVNLLDPGTIPSPGAYPNAPELYDESFHLHVDCRTALDSVVNADGSQARGSSGVTTRRIGTGRYLLSFGADIHTCAPVATVDTAGGPPVAIQAFLAYGSNATTIAVGINRADTSAVDAPFSVIVTCRQSPSVVYSSSDGFWNRTNIPNADRCALTASLINTVPGGAPPNQGYVATWSTDANTAVVQTKNGGYGISQSSGVALVATC